MSTRRIRSIFPTCLLFTTTLGLLACAEEEEADESAESSTGGAVKGTGPAADKPAASPGDKASSAEPLYAMMIQVYDTEDRTVYVHLTHTLDFGSEIDLGAAREFAGVANFAPVGGRLLISSGQEPAITEFEIADDLTWTEGRTVSFADYPFEDNANFYYQYILDDKTAYMPFDTTKRLVWNPTEMTIEGTLTDSSLELMQGNLRAQVGGNRNAIRFKGPVQQPFFYTDEDWFETGPESFVAIYDEKTHEEKSLVKLPCPGLSMASEDEQGNTYYGTWGFEVRAVFGEGPKPCVARLTPERTLDEAWTTDLRDLTGGRYSNNLRYIGKDKAIANVFHHELFEGKLDKGYDPDVAEAIGKSGPHWKLWLFDFDQNTAKPVEGIEVDTSSGAQFAVLEGRTFVFLPYNDWGRTKIYELDAEGQATEHADTLGDVFKWARVR